MQPRIARGEMPYSPAFEYMYREIALPTRIRLLKPVYRAEGEEKRLQFEVQYHERDTAPPYTAVSYTWSKQEKNCEILLGYEDEVFRITRDLEQCLEHLTADAKTGRRHASKDSDSNGQKRLGLQRPIPEWTHIWVDSICINQEDDDEKNMQVSLMSRTYSEATEVSVWLGGGTVHNRHSDWRNEDVLRSLLQHRYWTRTWVIQEFLLSKATTLHFGCASGSCISLGTFIHYATRKDRHGTRPLDSGRSAELLLGAKMPGISISERAPGSDWAWWNAPRESLHLLIQRYQRSNCQDPRDKVFALLSLMPPKEQDLIQLYFPDYSLPMEMVAVLTLLHIIHCDSQTLQQACDVVFLAFGIRNERQREKLKKAASDIPRYLYLEPGNSPYRGGVAAAWSLYPMVWRRIRPGGEWFRSPEPYRNYLGLEYPECRYWNRDKERDKTEIQREKKAMGDKIQEANQRAVRIRNVKVVGLIFGIGLVGRLLGWWSYLASLSGLA